MTTDYIYAGGSVTQKVVKYLKSSLNKVSESDIYDGIIFAITEDTDYIYCGGSGYPVPQIWKIRKSDMVKVDEIDCGSPVKSLVNDKKYLYAGYDIGKIWKIRKSDMSKIGEITIGDGIYGINSIAEDTDYIYCNNYVSPNFNVWKIRKSDMTKVGESDNYGSFIHSIVGDTDYIYCGGDSDDYVSFKVWKIRKSDMVKVGESDNYGSIINSLTEDTDYIYCGGGAWAGKIWKIRKSDMIKIGESSISDDYIAVLTNDNDYVYYAGGWNQNGKIIRLNKSDLSMVDSSIEYAGTIYDIVLSYSEPDTIIYTIAKPILFTSTQEINGAWYADMRISPDDYIEPESYIEKDNELYIVKNIKKIKSGGQTYFDVKLYHNMIELSELTIERFSLLDSVANLLNLILDGTIWNAGTCDINEKVYLKLDRRMSRLEALNLLADRCGGELYFHSKNRLVDLKREIGTNTGLQLRYDKNATYIEREEDSQDLITRIYAYGSDNFAMNTITLDDCDDETLWATSGILTASDNEKMQGGQAIKWDATALNQTCTRDLGAGNVIDLSGCDKVNVWIYSEVANANGVQFGIGKSAWNELTASSGALKAECWHNIELDLSGVVDSNKNAIRYLGFQNKTNGAATIIFDDIRSFSDVNYLDSPNRDKYKINKEYVYIHSAKPEKETFEKIIYVSEDTFVNHESPNKNYGTEWRFKVRDDTNRELISLIKFQLNALPIGAVITDATLNLHVTSTDFKSGANVDVQRAASNWSEYTVKWTNRPASAGNIGSFNGASTGWKEVDITSTVRDWWAGVNNYGLRLELNISDVDKSVNINSKESDYVPYLKVTYTMTTNPSDVIRAGAWDYMVGEERDIPRLKYKFNIVDLSEVIKNTWEDEVISLGDTCRAYDSDLGINTNVRVVKITRNHLDPSDIELELANKSYTMADLETKRSKQLSYAMPFKDRPNIIDATAIQAGQIGEDVNR